MADKSANTVPYWGYYGSGQSFDYDPASTGPGSQFLDALRKLDPNAAFVQGTSGGGEGGPGQPNWTLHTSVKFPGIDLNANDFDPQYYSPNDSGGFQANGGHSFDTSQLKNPGAVQQSGTFGAYTPWSNLKPQSSTLLDYLGPAAVGLFGLAAPALLGGFQAGAAGAGAAAGDASGAAAASGGDLAGGLGGGAADELANGGQMLATAPAANGASIAISNALDSLGLPTQIGLSDGAVGGALASPGGILSGGAGLLGGTNPFSLASRVIGGTGGGVAGGGPGGGLMALGGAPSRGATPDLLSLLKSFYGDPSLTGRQYLAMEKSGGLYG